MNRREDETGFNIARDYGSIGAEIACVDLANALDARTRQAFIDAWHRHLVLVVRGQKLDHRQLAAFSRNFGELERSPIPESRKGAAHVPDVPEVAVISNVVVDGIPIGALGDGEADWHTDMSYIPHPPPGCMLYAVEVPPRGADTWFTNMYEAYDAVPPSLKRRIEDLDLNHDASTTSTGQTRRGFEMVTDVSKAPGERHPIMQAHPRTGRKALYLGRRLHAWIVGLPVAESEALLDELWTYAARPEHSYRHKWKVGDLIMWDNRCVMHRRDGWDPSLRRILLRTQIGASTAF